MGSETPTKMPIVVSNSGSAATMLTVETMVSESFPGNRVMLSSNRNMAQFNLLAGASVEVMLEIHTPSGGDLACEVNLSSEHETLMYRVRGNVPVTEDERVLDAEELP